MSWCYGNKFSKTDHSKKFSKTDMMTRVKLKRYGSHTWNHMHDKNIIKILKTTKK